MEMNRQQKIDRLQDLQKALEGCTRHIEGHTDPGSINDYWNWMRELLADIKDEDEKLLLRAEQFECEQKAICELPERIYPQMDKDVLTGVSRMVNFIKRHLGVTPSQQLNNK